MNPKPDQFDHLLDLALSTYTPAEANPWLEQRLQAAIHAASNTPSKAGRPFPRLWAFALPMAAAVLLIGAIATLYFPHYSEETNRASIPNPPSPTMPGIHQEKHPPTAQHAPGKTTHRRAINQPGKRPTQPSLPSTSLEPTEQEQQLFQLAALHPDAAQSILDLQANRDKPIQVGPIQNKPLRIETVCWNAIPVQQLDIPPIDMATRQPPTRPSSF